MDIGAATTPQLYERYNAIREQCRDLAAEKLLIHTEITRREAWGIELKGTGASQTVSLGKPPSPEVRPGE